MRVDPALQDKPWLVSWCNSELTAVATTQAAVDGKRWRPGTRPSDLMREFPSSFDAPEFRDLRDALEELDRLFRSGLDADWDWSSGFPPGWPTSVKDRVRSFVSWRDS